MSERSPGGTAVGGCSVIIPAFNAESYLAQAIDSALAQTYANVEVIVANDGSTDGTREVALGFGDHIIYLEQQNKGTPAARNLALTKATGKYIGLLDADDYWLPNRIERLVGFLERNPGLGAVTSDSYLVLGGAETTQTYYRDGGGSLGFKWEDQLYWIHQYDFVHVMAVIRTEVVDSCSGFDEDVPSGVEDWDFWIRTIGLGTRVGFVPEPLGYYRVRGESQSHTLAKAYENQLCVLERALSRPNGRSLKGLSGRVNFSRASLKLAQGNFGESRKEFFAAARDPALPLSARLRAAIAWSSPRTAWRLHSRRFARSM